MNKTQKANTNFTLSCAIINLWKASLISVKKKTNSTKVYTH